MRKILAIDKHDAYRDDKHLLHKEVRNVIIDGPGRTSFNKSYYPIGHIGCRCDVLVDKVKNIWKRHNFYCVKLSKEK